MLPFNGLRYKRLSAIALLILLVQWQTAICQTGILDSVFTFRAGTTKTVNALNLITRQTGYYFTYDSRLIIPDKKTDMTFSNVKLNVILQRILQNDSLEFSVIDKYIIISKAVSPPASEIDSLPPAELNLISGIIVDEESGDPLPFATIALKNKGKGTVTNSNGEFQLKITPDCLNDTLSLSYLGFIGREIPVKQSLGNNFRILMKREFISIPEIVIRTQIPQEIIFKTVASIPRNYGSTPAMLTGFYREGVMKKNNLQSYSEAVLQIYKSAYSGSLLSDQIKIYKSRKIENMDLHDTLAVRLKAGLSTCLELDGAKNLFDFIDRISMPEYSYRISDIVTYDDEAAWVIDFEQREGVEEPLFKGSIYINTDDYAILNAEFELNPKYINKLKDSFILSTSHGFSTWPASVKYMVTYRKDNNRYFLSHVRGDLVFVSKQKKKLFNSQFNVFFELAVTSINLENVQRFEREELAPIHAVFSKTIETYDADFWQNQNFLKPEDNLLQALKNMNVRLLEFNEKP
jgi:CarboxypepD_reg-like domain